MTPRIYWREAEFARIPAAGALLYPNSTTSWGYSLQASNSGSLFSDTPQWASRDCHRW